MYEVGEVREMQASVNQIGNKWPNNNNVGVVSIVPPQFTLTKWGPYDDLLQVVRKKHQFEFLIVLDVEKRTLS